MQLYILFTIQKWTMYHILYNNTQKTLRALWQPPTNPCILIATFTGVGLHTKFSLPNFEPVRVCMCFQFLPPRKIYVL